MIGLSTITRSAWKSDTFERAVLKLRSISGTSRYRKFVIVGTARTGSTLLINLLRGHSQVRVFGELFRSPEAIGWDVKPFATLQSFDVVSLYRADPVAFLENHVFRRWPRPCGAVGFKLFYYHARTPEHSVVWDYLAADPEIRVLHLRRRNLLAQYYSLRLAHQTNSWTKAAVPKGDPAPMRLGPQECQDHFGWVRALEEECAAFFGRHDVYDIWYEDLVAEQEQTMTGIQEFLGLARYVAKPTIARQRTTPLRLAIANYDDLSKALHETPWSVFFDEEDVGGAERRRG
jgi:LPS sulfotransferase NodH